MNGSTARRAAALALLTLVLDPPINDWPRFVAWMAGLLAVVAAPPPKSWRRIGLAALVCLLALVGRHSLPALHIDEAHNYFLPGPAGPVVDGLPPPVLSALDQQFRERYPLEYWCEPQASGCWQRSVPLPARFAFSADAFLRGRPYSRVVRTISFRGLGELRAGFTNRVETNWWDRSSDVRRRDMPFYVMYVLPAEAAGAALCWRGDVFWEERGGFQDLSSSTGTCRTIGASDAGRRVFGISVGHVPLSMRLQLTPSLARTATATQALALLGAAVAMLVVLWPLPYRLVLSFALAAVGAVSIGTEALASLRRYDPIGGGSDGIPYESYAHTILERVEAGDLAEALKGVEPSFFFMPGLRYFRALEKAIFGETYLGYLAVLLLMPAVLLRFLRVFLPAALAVLLWCAFFLPLPVADRFWWSFRSYVDLARGGLAEPLAQVMWLGGAALLLSGTVSATGPRRHAPWGSFVLSLACVVRPNLLIASGLLLLFVGHGLWRTAGWREVRAVWLAFTPFLWVPLHNYIYAGRLELASRVIGPATVTPPAVYGQALRDGLAGHGAGAAAQQIAAQLGLWIDSPVRATALAVTALGLVLRRVPFANRALVLGVIGLHAVLLFWAPGGRYSHLAWQVTLVSATANIFFLTSPAVRRARLMLPPRLANIDRRALSWRRIRAPLAAAAVVLMAVELAFRMAGAARAAETPPSRERCLTLSTAGGSTTESLRQPAGESWPGRLESELSRILRCVDVKNAGRTDFATFGQHRLLDQLVLGTRPDALLLLPGLEDMGRERALPIETAPLWPAWLRDILTSYSALASAILLPDPQRGRVLTGDMQATIAALPNAPVNRRKSQLLLVRHRQTYVPAYRGRLEEIVRVSRARGVEPILLTQPALYGGEIDPATQRDLRWLEVDREAGIHGSLAWRLLEEYNDATRAIGREQAVQVIDLAHLLPKDSRLYADFVHFSREGALQVAVIVARELCPTMARRFPELVQGSCPREEASPPPER